MGRIETLLVVLGEVSVGLHHLEELGFDPGTGKDKSLTSEKQCPTLTTMLGKFMSPRFGQVIKYCLVFIGCEWVLR